MSSPAGTGGARSSSADLRQELGDMLERELEGSGVPGAVLAAFDGSEIHAAAAGVANLETGLPVTTESQFQIGSIGKTFTATALMRLADDGLLALDEPVVQCLPEFAVADPDATRGVTVRQLLTHTSGIDGDWFPEFEEPRAIAQFVAGCSKLAQLHAPGERFSYCNSGYVVLGRVIERLLGAPFDHAMRELVLEDLGATSAHLGSPERPELDQPVGHLGEGRTLRVARHLSLPYCVAPAGTLVMTARDLLRLALLHLRDGRTENGRQLLAAPTAQAMRRPHVEFDYGSLAGWGLGPTLWSWGGEHVVGHDGETVGQMAFLRWHPRSGTAIALLTNSGVGFRLYGRLFPELAERLFGVRPDWTLPQPDAGPIELDRYAGRYERLNFVADVEVDGDALKLTARTSGEIAELWEVDGPATASLRAIDAQRFAVEGADDVRQLEESFRDFGPDGRPHLLMLGWRAYKRTQEQ